MLHTHREAICGWTTGARRRECSFLAECMLRGEFAYEGVITVSPIRQDETCKDRQGKWKQTWPQYFTLMCGSQTALTPHNHRPQTRPRAQCNTRPQARTQEMALWYFLQPAWVEVSPGWVPVDTHSTPVPGLPGRLWVAHRPHTTAQPRHDNLRAQLSSRDDEVPHDWTKSLRHHW